MQLTRHESLYFHDGNVVLRSMEDAQGSTLFRVHQSVLEHHSKVFKDMFSLPTVPGLNEVYDGAPLVAMTDQAEALEILLGIIYRTRCGNLILSASKRLEPCPIIQVIRIPPS